MEKQQVKLHLCHVLIAIVSIVGASFVECFGRDETYFSPSGLPMEKVYLHLDNTGYYNGDKIWFKAYVVNAGGNVMPPISNTLYVELLNPGGELIERKIYRIENGHAHGDFLIKHLPFYEGYYELRAYTKYMLNFAESNYFSRVIPIFDNSKGTPDSDNTILDRRFNYKFKTLRKQPRKEKKLNIKFYPEGGYLIKGIPSLVAFEATDALGHPLDVTGTLMIGDSVGAVDINVSHEGKGGFSYTPTGDKSQVFISHEGKKYKFKLPDPLDSGYALAVDNLTDENNVKVRVTRAGSESKDTVGIMLLSQGSVIDYVYIASTFEKPFEWTFDKGICYPGVSEILLVDKDNERIANRYFFSQSDETFTISATLDKSEYAPFQPIDLLLSLKQKDGNPIQSPFSLSVRDGSSEVKWNRNIMTDLLLMSDVKGYVANPSYYFESNDEKHCRDLDLLLMVQGWQRYPWNRIKNLSIHNLRYKPESNGILVNGIVSSYNLKKPKEGIDVSVLMVKHDKEENGERPFLENKFTTDSLGRFNFVADVDGDWDFVLAASKDMKKKNLTISLDSQFSPAPRDYAIHELNLERNEIEDIVADENNEDVVESSSIFEDSIDEEQDRKDGSVMLKGIEVKEKKSSKAYDIYKARASSIEYYDFKENIDKMYDSGDYYCNDVNNFLLKVNKNFKLINDGVIEYLIYKNKIKQLVLVVVDYEKTYVTYEFAYNYLQVEWIKSVYISEDGSLIRQYCDPLIKQPIERYSCVVFIETYLEKERPVVAGKGVRKTTFHGYDEPAEFYNPDYSDFLPNEEDPRRTLYWNPMVVPDENGNVRLRIFNNGKCKCPVIDAQVVTGSGMIGISEVN